MAGSRSKGLPKLANSTEEMFHVQYSIGRAFSRVKNNGAIAHAD